MRFELGSFASSSSWFLNGYVENDYDMPTLNLDTHQDEDEDLRFSSPWIFIMLTFAFMMSHYAHDA